MSIKSYARHFEKTVVVEAGADRVFAYANDHNNFSSHMNQSSWMMGGASMKIETDQGKGQKVGSHIRIRGKVFGINLFLDEVIVGLEPPRSKAWETVGEINLLVIDHYRLGFEIIPKGEKSEFKVYIDYNLPKLGFTSLLGRLLGGVYAKWCVEQMVDGAQKHLIPYQASS